MRRKLRDGCDVLIGNCLDTLKALPDESIHCCITSPPYYGLRDYGGEDEQIGLEETPEQFIENLVKVFREVKRVLHSSGTLWLNIGDSYWGGKGASGQVKPKDLIGIPWMLAFALRADGWYLRQDIIWLKPNPMPEAVRDRCTKSHEYIFLLSKSKSYYFDNEAIREKGEMTKGSSAGSQQRNTTETHGLGGGNTGINKAKERLANELKTLGYSTRNKRDVWQVNVKPFREAHFATYPPELIEPCVLAGTSAKGCCSKCGNPYVRIIERAKLDHVDFSDRNEKTGVGHRHRKIGQEYDNWLKKNPHRTIGWQPTCDCKNAEQIPCTVLDPFGGSGTTAGVALKHKRNAILCELNDSYIDLMAGRIKEITGLHDGQKTLFTLFQDW